VRQTRIGTISPVGEIVPAHVHHVVGEQFDELLLNVKVIDRHKAYSPSLMQMSKQLGGWCECHLNVFDDLCPFRPSKKISSPAEATALPKKENIQLMQYRLLVHWAALEILRSRGYRGRSADCDPVTHNPETDPQPMTFLLR